MQSGEADVIIPERIGNDDLVAMDAALYAAIEKIAADMLSSGSRSERDRLLVASLASALLVAAPKFPANAQLFGLTLEPADLRLFPLGLSLILIYFIISFAMMAFSDRLRWKAATGIALADPKRWAHKLNGQMDAIRDAMAKIYDQTRAKVSDHQAYEAAKLAEIAAIEGRPDQAARPLSGSELQAVAKIYAELAERSRALGLIESNEQVEVLRDRSIQAGAAFEQLGQLASRWRFFSLAQFWISAALPLIIAAMCLIGLLGKLRSAYL